MPCAIGGRKTKTVHTTSITISTTVAYVAMPPLCALPQMASMWDSCPKYGYPDLASLAECGAKLEPDPYMVLPPAKNLRNNTPNYTSELWRNLHIYIHADIAVTSSTYGYNNKTRTLFTETLKNPNSNSNIFYVFLPVLFLFGERNVCTTWQFHYFFGH